MAAESTDSCSWCGAAVEAEDGWRAGEVPGARRATFCRLEHIVPWSMQGPHWEPGEPEQPEEAPTECAQCGAELGEVRFVLVRHRGEHRIPDGFCSADHLAAWARSGGRWRQP